MSRTIVLVFLLVVLIITSQFEWKQQLANEFEENPTGNSQNQHYDLAREEMPKEKIILSQERNIQRLNNLLQNLKQQLLQCQDSNGTVNIFENSMAGKVLEG